MADLTDHDNAMKWRETLSKLPHKVKWIASVVGIVLLLLCWYFFSYGPLGKRIDKLDERLA